MQKKVLILFQIYLLSKFHLWYELYYENIQNKNPTTTAIIYNSKKFFFLMEKLKKEKKAKKNQRVLPC